MKTRSVLTAATLALVPSLALAGSWRFQREKDEMTDEQIPMAYVMNGTDYRHTEMWARCNSNNSLSLWFWANDFIGSSSSNGGTNDIHSSRISISYRVNDEQAVIGRDAHLSAQETSFFIEEEDKEAIIRGLLGNRLILEWRDYRGVGYSVRVSTRGATAALKRLPCAAEYIPVCGDGKVQRGESCDEGKANSNSPSAVCRKDCTRTPISQHLQTECGNSSVEQGETCDDGNNTSGDGCEADCTRTPPQR